jgi:hypothetical protein
MKKIILILLLLISINYVFWYEKKYIIWKAISDEMSLYKIFESIWSNEEDLLSLESIFFNENYYLNNLLIQEKIDNIIIKKFKTNWNAIFKWDIIIFEENYVFYKKDLIKKVFWRNLDIYNPNWPTSNIYESLYKIKCYDDIFYIQSNNPSNNNIFKLLKKDFNDCKDFNEKFKIKSNLNYSIELKEKYIKNIKSKYWDILKKLTEDKKEILLNKIKILRIKKNKNFYLKTDNFIKNNILLDSLIFCIKN